MSRKLNSRAPLILVGLFVALLVMWVVMIVSPSLPEQTLSLKESMVLVIGMIVALLMYWDTRRLMH